MEVRTIEDAEAFADIAQADAFDIHMGHLLFGDADAIVAAAHSLKSSAGNLGAAALGQRAAEIERRGRNGAAADVLAPMVGSLRDAFTKACAALEVMRADIARRIA